MTILVDDMNKHAYLIMAHNHFVQLGKMLRCLDDEAVDIFLHIDKKAKCDKEVLTKSVSKSKLYFTKQVSVNWGGYSQIEAEIILLEEATSVGHYKYLHFLTGVDFPLKKQKDILEFYNNRGGENFISIGKIETIDTAWYADRIIYYYPFQEQFTRRNILGKFLRKSLCLIQKKVGINRLKESNDFFSIGSAYFDITDRFARYIVSQKDTIRQKFKSTFCADEIFVQWLWLNWPAHDKEIYVAPEKADHPYISRQYLNVKRAIDWTRGKPYTYRITDYEMLMTSGCLFARKLDDTIDAAIIDKLTNKILCEK